MRWLLFLMAICPVALGQQRITPELWAGIEPIYEDTLRHPFLRGLTDGSLAKSRFQFYLVQDGLYLRAFSQALSILAAKAPKEEWATTLNRHAIESIETERQLHESILRSWGLDPAAARQAEMAPSNYAYTNHLLAVAYRGSFAEGLAAVLPCYWIYWEVGKHLKKQGSRDESYQRWIDQYADPAYGKTVELVLGMMDDAAAGLDRSSRARLKAHFTRSSRYEWMFWDMAWREEAWKP